MAEKHETARLNIIVIGTPWKQIVHLVNADFNVTTSKLIISVFYSEYDIFILGTSLDWILLDPRTEDAIRIYKLEK